MASSNMVTDQKILVCGLATICRVEVLPKISDQSESRDDVRLKGNGRGKRGLRLKRTSLILEVKVSPMCDISRRPYNNNY
jgi:hypothetical protein